MLSEDNNINSSRYQPFARANTTKRITYNYRRDNCGGRFPNGLFADWWWVVGLSDKIIIVVSPLLLGTRCGGGYTIYMKYNTL